MEFAILHKRTKAKLFANVKANSFKKVMELAVQKNANLKGANLEWADLKGANLEWANLEWADMKGASLEWANLKGANLNEVDLEGANLEGANLEGANLKGANLKGANLKRANLEGANLNEVDLTETRDDLWAIFSIVPNEVSGLRQALMDGKVNGSKYEGDCACLIGTISHLRQCHYHSIPNLVPNWNRPAERFFLAIRPCDTPDNSTVVHLVVKWIDTWLENVQSVPNPV